MNINSNIDRDATLKWMDEVCQTASNEFEKTHNAALVASMGKHDSLSYYFTNVVRLKTLTKEQFAAQFPQFIVEADSIRRQYEAAEAVPVLESRIAAIEKQLERLPDLLLSEFAKLREAAPVKGKPGRKPKLVEAEIAEAAEEAADADDETEEDEIAPETAEETTPTGEAEAADTDAEK